jgi:aldehyde dehydrogenase (NAD+)
MATQGGNYVGGEWRDATTGETFTVTNPAHTSETVAEYPLGDDRDIDEAVDAANGALASWAETPGPERGAVLRRAGDALADRKDEATATLTREEGKTHAEAAPEVQRAIDIFYHYASKASEIGGTVKASSSRDTTLYTTREPVGVAGLVTPWNYPIAIPAWKLAPALAAGNTVVCKPARLAPGTATILAECLEEAGIPDGVFNLVNGSGSTAGARLIEHPDVDAISFTGSSAVGEQVYQDATDDGKRVQTEMGGKNPAIVMPSADVEEAVDIVAAGAFGVTGQACTATSRALVHEDVLDAFVDGIVEAAEARSIGPGDEGYDTGPQASESELDGTLEYIEIAQNEGATLATGGDRVTDDPCGDGYFVEPTVFTDVERDMRIANEEVFGPVLAVLPVSDFEDAIDVANGVDYGLSASIVTDDHGEANRFVDEIEAGVAKVNEKTTGLELHVPFGGVKRSSSETYKEQGDAGIEFYTKIKTVYDNY